MSERKQVNINGWHHQIVLEQAQANGGLTIQAMAQAMIRGWAMLAPEQQVAAIKGKPTATEPPAGASLEDAADLTLVAAASQAVHATSELMTTVASAAADGDITPAEAERINAECRETVACACRTAEVAKARKQHN